MVLTVKCNSCSCSHCLIVTNLLIDHFTSETAYVVLYSLYHLQAGVRFLQYVVCPVRHVGVHANPHANTSVAKYATQPNKISCKTYVPTKCKSIHTSMRAFPYRWKLFYSLSSRRCDQGQSLLK